MMRKFIHILPIVLLSSTVWAQLPTPAQQQSNAILLKGGIAHLGNGEVINNSYIGFDKGKITLVADATRVKMDFAGYTIIDIESQHVYPGFILPNTQLGLEEVSSVESMNDGREVLHLGPNVRSLVAYNTDSKMPPTLRFNGILMAETTPKGGRISGTSSVMNLDGWNWEDAVLKPDVGLHINWPRNMTSHFDYTTYKYIKEPNKKYNAQVSELDKFFSDSKSYNEQSSKERNLKLEAMEGLFSGDKILFIHADEAKDIVDAIAFTQGFGISKIVMVSGMEAIDVASYLAENKIPVVLPNVHSLPENDDMAVDLPLKLAYILTKAGVTVCLSKNGMLASARNLPFFAGTTVAYGLDKEEAVKLITLNPAKILGIDDQVGSLKEGKRATLFVSKGDALDMMTNDLSYAFIDGKQLVLEGEQQALYKRYSEKYKGD